MADPQGVRCARQGFDPHAIEKEATQLWREKDVPARARKLREGRESFYFVDGPPYTSGHIHLGTAWNKVMKDLNVRFWRMQGLHVRDQPGYDMHGLPIEVKVEKELGLTTKQGIEDLGVEAFVDKCRSFALEFLDTMTEEFKELGVWLDWDRPYRTIDDSYIEGAWWAIKRGHEKDLLYRDNRGGLPWCPRCETALAQAEVEYEDRTDPSIYVKFPLTDEDASLVIWTTTPWTLPANNAVAVHPELQYARVLATKRDGSTETIIVEETVVEDVARAARYTDVTVMDHIPGEEMEGWAYHHPFRDEVPYHQEKRADAEYTVILGEHVAADRTGLVHTATGHGAEDYEIGLTYGIPPFCPVGPDGTYTELAGELADLIVKKEDDPEAEQDGQHADPEVIQRLKAKGLLLA
ncbi:MAG: class I tRNA ligase family protein, partial [Candidatus Thermoplasmatota archaeon]|nr:class I tRNA ligase family protein [Candidatus Thermoplasmatota archaeon]